MTSLIDSMLAEVHKHLSEVGFEMPMLATIVCQAGWLIGRYDISPEGRVHLTVLSQTPAERGGMVPPIRLTLRDSTGRVHRFEIGADGSRLH